jgi:deoxyribonuclease I
MSKHVLWIQLIVLLTLTGFTDFALGNEIKRKFFHPSSLISFENSKIELKEIYIKGDHRETLHCGCTFDELLQVSSNICAHSPRSFNTQPASKEFVEWVHAMPLQVIGEKLKCRTEKLCSTATAPQNSGPPCCNQVSPKFKIIQADMHNIFPSIRTVPGPTLTHPKTSFGGMEENRLCATSDTALPLAHVRGDLARAYFYTSIQYRIPIPEELENDLRTWHYQDPPDAWEEKRNSLIETVQGNRNPFIDHPELAERVQNF